MQLLDYKGLMLTSWVDLKLFQHYQNDLIVFDDYSSTDELTSENGLQTRLEGTVEFPFGGTESLSTFTEKKI